MENKPKVKAITEYFSAHILIPDLAGKSKKLRRAFPINLRSHSMIKEVIKHVMPKQVRIDKNSEFM